MPSTPPPERGTKAVLIQLSGDHLSDSSNRLSNIMAAVPIPIPAEALKMILPLTADTS